MTDRRDAELDELLQLARQCNDAEFIYEALEQDKLERDAFKNALEYERSLNETVIAPMRDRLAKVPALVEALRQLLGDLDAHTDESDPWWPMFQLAESALDAYDQEHA